MKNKKLKIAFFGIGTMGEPMAELLMEAGHELMVYNRTPDKTRNLEQRGAAKAANPAQAVKWAEVSIVMLADFNAIRSVLFNESQTNSWRDKTFIQMSTISPAQNLELKARIESDGGEFLEAPVLGGVPQLQAKTLQVMVGGSKTQYEKWRWLFAPFSDYRFHVGEVGQGAVMKLALNQVSLSHFAAFSMSLGYLRENSADIDTFMEMLRNFPFYAKVMDWELPIFMNRDYSEMRFPLKLMLKDARLMRDHFEETGIETAPLQGIADVLRKAVEQGHGERDCMAIYDAFHPPESDQ